MYPRSYFDTYWRGNLEPKVFVAMPFADSFDAVWDQAIRPAIECDLEGGQRFTAHRVDFTKASGSIPTEILAGIAHDTLVFADISTLPIGRSREQRNANVMYEVGLATAVRPEEDLILVKSDASSVNFDLLPIRVHQYDRNDLAAARKVFAELLESALESGRTARRELAKQTWDKLDRACLNFMVVRRGGPFREDPRMTEADRATLRYLLQLGIVETRYLGLHQDSATGREFHDTRYEWTAFGRAVCDNPNLPSEPQEIRTY